MKIMLEQNARGTWTVSITMDTREESDELLRWVDEHFDIDRVTFNVNTGRHDLTMTFINLYNLSHSQMSYVKVRWGGVI